MIRLTPKEVEVLQLSALGLNDREIAERLGVKTHVVGARAGRAQGKLGVRCRAHAVALLIASKVIKSPEPVDVAVIAPGGRLVDFAEDFAIYQRRGLNNGEIAEVMGYRNGKVVERLAWRARAAGLLPRPNRRVTP